MMTSFPCSHPEEEAPLDFLRILHMLGLLQDHHLGDDELIVIPAALSDSGQLHGQRAYEAPDHILSCIIMPAQWKDHEVKPPLSLSIILNPSSEVATIICMKPLYVDCLYMKVHWGRHISLKVSHVRVLLVIRCFDGAPSALARRRPCIDRRTSPII